MPDARRPRPTRRPRALAVAVAQRPMVHRRTLLIAVLAVLAALLVPAVFTTARAHADTHDPVGSLDAVSVAADGTVRVYGWAADPDAPTSAIKVSLIDNGVIRLTYFAQAARPDVAAAKPGYGANHGFDHNLSLTDGAHTVCVTAINVGGGVSDQLGCQSVTLHNNPTASLSTLAITGNTATATGTAVDPNVDGSVLVQLFRDGKLAASAPTDPDSHAFQLAASVAEGSHSLCFYALNRGAGGNTSLGCRTIQIRNNPFGALDSAGQTADGTKVTGWAIDLNTTAALTVLAWVDGKHVANAVASAPYGGLATTYPTEGSNHGYAFNLNLPQGTHKICVSANNVSYGASAFIGCESVTVRNNPIGSMDTAVQTPGAILVKGWTLDFNTVAPIAVHLYVDGKYKAQVRAAGTRTDVANRYPNVGAAHGFSASFRFATGSHVICAFAINIGPGTTTALPCKRVTITNTPSGAVEYTTQYPGGVRLGGWAVDPDSWRPITVQTYVDGKLAAGAVGSLVRPDLAKRFPYNGTGHGYAMTVPLTAGTHQVCSYALNVGPGGNTRLRCSTVTRLVNPVGASTGIVRAGVSNAITFGGWALDPDQLGASVVHITVDGKYRGSVTAAAAGSASLTQFPLYGDKHAFSGSINLDGSEHVVCVVLVNVGLGKDVVLDCKRILSSGQTVPAIPTQASAWPGSKQVTLSWAAPVATHGITRYQLTVNPGHRLVSVAAGATTVVAHYLTNGVPYTFTLQGVNSYGLGSGVTVAAVPTNIPPQVTPAPVSTSHYVRNLTGNLSSDAAMMRATGAADASHNPSGHSYLILLQIGGQDEADHGALLSATARFVTYPAVVSAMKAYLDGYATQQRPYAPLTLAIGTNNDVDVSASAGVSWARNIVNPVAAYAATKHAGTMIAGANDMEPGFSASVGATRNWLTGYLSATSARFVFNGSADGCSTGSAGAGCNNGWHMSDLQWLAGGASPSRTISLPQIYNYAMPLQWKYISLTGTNAGRSRINFGGPLTERTACAQAGGSCGSIANADAWNRLWAAISSVPAIRQTQLPNGTDLRIN